MQILGDSGTPWDTLHVYGILKSMLELIKTISHNQTTCSNGVNGNNMVNGGDHDRNAAMSDDGSSGIEDGLRELRNPTGKRAWEGEENYAWKN